MTELQHNHRELSNDIDITKIQKTIPRGIFVVDKNNLYSTSECYRNRIMYYTTFVQSA